jgi:hypothetical protein
MLTKKAGTLKEGKPFEMKGSKHCCTRCIRSINSQLWQACCSGTPRCKR